MGNKMKVLILSGYDDAMKEVGDRCTATHRNYAERRGYDCEVVRHYRPDTHPSHQKIRIIQERIDRYDRIMWLDADSVVMDMDQRPAEHWVKDGAVITISADWCCAVEDDEAEPITTIGVSCGNFIVSNTPDVHRFIDIWAKYSERYARRMACCWEQSGVRDAMKADQWINDRVHRLHRRKMNSVHHTCANRNFPFGAPKPYEPGDWLLHLTNVDRIAILNDLGL
jgi:hypothetical protein